MDNGGEDMMEKTALYPPWLLILLKTKFYEPCDDHDSRKCNFFCLDCTTTFCESCNDDDKHKDHSAVQVYKASNYPGIKTDVLQDLSINISDIQPYTINSNLIVYINQRPRRGNGNGAVNCNPGPILSNHDFKCKACHRGLSSQEPPLKYKFCSMECKVKKVNAYLQANTLSSNFELIGEFNGDVGASMVSSSNSSGPAADNNEHSGSQFHYLRNRKRKGIPRRSPF